MALDLVPRHDIGGFRLPAIPAWFVSRLLEGLGADSSALDADYIPAAAARQWAGLLREALRQGRISERRLYGSTSVCRLLPLVDGQPVIDGPIARHQDLLASLGACSVRVEDAALEPALAERILDLAGFFVECGGCWQR
jgi:hypothetical protein